MNFILVAALRGLNINRKCLSALLITSSINVLCRHINSCQLNLLPAATAANMEGSTRVSPLQLKTLCMPVECKIPLCRLPSHRNCPPPSPAGQLTGGLDSAQVEEPLPGGPLPGYNPSKWNQSATKHPTVASKKSPHLSLSWGHRKSPLWRPEICRVLLTILITQWFFTLECWCTAALCCLQQRKSVYFCSPHLNRKDAFIIFWIFKHCH